MKTHYLFLFLTLCFSGQLLAQSNKGTNFYGKDTNTDVCEQSGSFLQDDDVELLITDMLARYGAKNRFIIQSCSKIDNCQAVIFNGKPYILYNTNFLNKVKTLNFTTVAAPTGATSQDWRALGILAHELGHHVNNHLNNRPPDLTQRELELEADEYAGHMMYLMGATLTQAQTCLQEVPEKGSYTHPGKNERLIAIEKGYKDAKSKEKYKEKIVNIDDRDGDGLANNIDNCPDEKGPARNDGCPEVVPSPKTNPTPPKKDLPNLPEMVYVSGGTFTMGDTFGEGGADEKPTHEVTLSDYYIGKYEVTFEQYDIFCEATGRSKPDDAGWGRGKRPVINVSWEDATAYCAWASELSGKRYSLPTEAQWEYAARGRGQNVRFGNGKNILDPRDANFDGSGGEQDYSVLGEYRQKTLPVGNFSGNVLGLYDMTGNVWEWCRDWYDVYYSKSPSKDPENTTTGSYRVLRGGSWYDDARYCRTASRYIGAPDDRDYISGFRLVVVP